MGWGEAHQPQIDLTDEARARLNRSIATAGEVSTLRTTFARTASGKYIVEFEWRDGPADGERYTLVMSETQWRQYVDSVNEADQCL